MSVVIQRQSRRHMQNVFDEVEIISSTNQPPCGEYTKIATGHLKYTAELGISVIPSFCLLHKSLRTLCRHGKLNIFVTCLDTPHPQLKQHQAKGPIPCILRC